MKRFFTCLMLGIFIGGHAFAQCNLTKPTNVKVPEIYSCSATMTWNAVSGAAYYKVKYKVQNGTFTKLPDVINGTSFSFIGLSPNTPYTFAVSAFCANGDNGKWKQVNKTTPLCSEVLGPFVNNTTASTCSLSWVPRCGASLFKVRYKLSSDTKYTVFSDITESLFTLTDLTKNTSYDFCVQSVCDGDNSKWSDPITFTTKAGPPPISKPNFVVFVLDDGRYDSYRPSGGPSWFVSPSVERIANEGANFTYTFPTTSQCAPSRVSIYTGLYAHHHGALDNDTRMTDSIPLVQQILQDHGYRTGFVGKYGQLQGKPKGFDFWATSDGNIYVDANFHINNTVDTIIEGHITDVYQDLALAFLDSVPVDTPFMLMFFTRVPHGPIIPRPQDALLYLSDTMPFPSNFVKYTVNFPSYFYDVHNWHYNQHQTDSLNLLQFQSLIGVEDNMTAIIDWLEQRNILDSTMIIFSSDNGYLMGEHKLDAKQIAQEESIRIPLYIRFPSWFDAGSVFPDKMATNIDFAPTMLEAAHIVDTIDVMDGISLKQLADGDTDRQYFFYQYAGESGAPSIRAVRSLTYKYVKHYCTSTVEEFYDLVNDPKEDDNLINNSSYATLIQSYRDVLDSIRIAVGDYTPVSINCNLSNPQRDLSNGDEDENVNDRILRLWPSPADAYFIISFNEARNKEDARVDITNGLGMSVFRKNVQQADILNMVIDCRDWLPGMYLVKLSKGNQTYLQKVIVGTN